MDHIKNKAEEAAKEFVKEHWTGPVDSTSLADMLSDFHLHMLSRSPQEGKGVSDEPMAWMSKEGDIIDAEEKRRCKGNHTQGQQMVNSRFTIPLYAQNSPSKSPQEKVEEIMGIVKSVSAPQLFEETRNETGLMLYDEDDLRRRLTEHLTKGN